MTKKQPKAAAPTPLAEPLIGHKLLTDAHVTELTGLDRRHRQQLEAAGEFPLPIRLTQKLRLYPSGEVLGWIQARSAQR
jgi:predicted DNA-binding transcriptional regulator AlpA